MVEVKIFRVTAVVVGALALAAVLPNVAQAATYCVQNPQCVANGGSERGTLPAAVTIANSVPGHDVIEVGPGRIAFAGPSVEASGNDGVDIVGQGQGSTTLVASTTMNQPVLTLNAESAVVKNLSIAVPDGANNTTALSLPSGGAEDIRLYTEGTIAGRVTAIDATSDMSDVFMRRIKIDWPLNNSGSTTPIGVNAVATGSDVITLQDSEISAYGAVAVQPKSNGHVNIDRVDIKAMAIGVFFGCPNATACTATMHDSRIAIRNFPGANDTVVSGVALISNGAANSSGVMSVNHTSITLDGSDAANTIGVASRIGSFNLQNSVISGGTTSLEEGAANGANFLRTFNSVYDRSTVNSFGFGQLQETAPLDVDPKFFNRATGDLRLRYDSALVDSATDTMFGVPTGTTDFIGQLRTVDGNGDGSTRADIGAYEYQRQPPSAAARASAAKIKANSPITFTASGSDPDPGDVLTYHWEFSDGSSATGASVTKAFSKTGVQSGKVTVSDPTGLKGSATAAVSVDALPCINAGVARTKRLKLRGAPPLRLSVSPSSLHVGATAKVTIDLQGRGRKLKAAVNKLKRSLRTVELRSGKKLLTTLSARKRTRSFSTAQLKPGSTTLTVKVVPKRGKPHTLTTKIKLAPRC